MRRTVVPLAAALAVAAALLVPASAPAKGLSRSDVLELIQHYAPGTAAPRAKPRPRSQRPITRAEAIALIERYAKPGPRGRTGARGRTGDAGPQGAKGDAGPAGSRGERGEQGPQGQQGPQGDPGPQGEAGAQGDQGPQGERGPQGEPGTPATPNTAGDGLTLGGSAFSVDFATVQHRLTGACDPDTWLTGVAEDGGPSCDGITLPLSLTGTSSASALGVTNNGTGNGLMVSNGGGGTAIYSQAAGSGSDAIGIWANGNTGVRGMSSQYAGVHGWGSGSAVGVLGESDGSSAAVQGFASGSGTGVAAQSEQGVPLSVIPSTSPPGGRNAGDMYVDMNGALWVWGRGNATTGTMAWHRVSFAN